MSDERDPSGAAGDGGEAGEVDASTAAGRHSQTAVATPQVTGPLRPTGKRSRQRAQAGGGAADNGTGDVASTATELTESSADAATEKTKTARKGPRTKQKSDGPSRNPLIFVYNYLKQVVAELRKVIWPNRKQMVTYTGVVLAFLVFMVALIAGSDYGFAKLVLLVFGE